MKRILCSFLLLTTCSAFAVTSEEYNQRFFSKLAGYFHNSEVRLSLKERSPSRITIKACQPKIKRNVLTFNGFQSLIDSLTTNQRQPIFSRVDKTFTDCVVIGELKSMGSQIDFKISDLMENPFSVDLTLKASHFIFSSRDHSLSVSSEAFLIDSILKGQSELYVQDMADFDVKVVHRKTKYYKASQLKKLRSTDPLLIIDVLSKNEENSQLFAGNAGVSEGYTIKEHTLRVLETVNLQYNCHISPELAKRMSAYLGQNFQSYMRFLMSLHDLGKSRAVDEGKKYLQHEYILPVMKKNFAEAKYGPEATQLAVALMDNEVLGHFLMKKIDTNTAVEQLKSLAASVNLSTRDFFQIQKAYYTFDAGSYPYLGQLVFKEDEKGCMHPSADRFKALTDQI